MDLNGNDGNDEPTLEQVLAEDPLLTYALPDDPEGEEGEEGEESESIEDKAARKAAEILAKRQQTEARPAEPVLDDQTKAILERLKTNPELLDRVLNPPVPVNHQTQPPQQFDATKIAKDFEDAFLESPQKGAQTLIAGILQAAQVYQAQQAEQMAQTRMGSVDMAIDSYMNRASQDPLIDADVQAEMQKIIDKARRDNPQGIARLNRQQIANALEEVKAQAYGAVQLRKQQAQRNKAPNYGSRSVTGFPTAQGLTLTKAERSFVENLRDAGLSQKEVRQALKELREESQAS